MGLGAYLAAVTERSHYIAEENRERKTVMEDPGANRDVIYRILKEYEIDYKVATAFVHGLARSPDMWIKVRSAPCSMMLRVWRTDEMTVHHGL